MMCTQGTHYGHGEDWYSGNFAKTLADYLECGKPLTIAGHRETLGGYIPTQKRDRNAERHAFRAAAEELDAKIAGWGAREEELMSEYKEIRSAGRVRKRKRNGR
jgi:hypothetical protein